MAANNSGDTSNNDKIALITGITGQDGSYLAELLISKGYQVHGLIRRSSSFNTGRIEHLYSNPQTHEQGSMKLHYGDMSDTCCLIRLIREIKPNEVYNLAAQSHVKVSFESAEYTGNVTGMGVLRFLEAIRESGLMKKVKFYQASSSEMFGKVQAIPQNENTPFHPRSPYACAKLFAHWSVINYREAYGLFAVSGILFNHESPRRGETFVTRKITRSVAKIHLGQLECFELGNLDAKRDWGHARDYVEAMWLMLQQEQPDDYVIATGETYSVREFVEAAFQHIGKTIEWSGSGLDEVAIEPDSGVVRVRINEKFLRPAEVEFLLGDAKKAQQKLGWKPSTTFKSLVQEMVDSDIEMMRKNPRA